MMNLSSFGESINSSLGKPKSKALVLVLYVPIDSQGIHTSQNLHNQILVVIWRKFQRFEGCVDLLAADSGSSS